MKATAPEVAYMVKTLWLMFLSKATVLWGSVAIEKRPQELEQDGSPFTKGGRRELRVRGQIFTTA